MNFEEKITKAYQEKIANEKAKIKAELAKQERIVRRELEAIGIRNFEGFFFFGHKVKYANAEGQIITLMANINTDFNAGFVQAWRVEGICPVCGETCWSKEVNDLAGIGQMVYDFFPCGDHIDVCKGQIDD